MDKMNKIIDLCLYELDEANKEFPPFHSAHEGYAVLLEELEETIEALEKQIPKKPIAEKIWYNNIEPSYRFYCPLCRKFQVMPYTQISYCNECGQPTESDAVRLNESYVEYADKLNKATRQMLMIDKIIQTVPDWRGRYVLTEHYLRLRPIDAIGEDDILQRCGRQTRRYHDEAIAYLEERSRRK